MRLRFIGKYTHGRDSITLCGVTFTGREPTETDEPRLLNHPEFERVEAAPVQTAEVQTVAAPFKKRGRPRKAD